MTPDHQDSTTVAELAAFVERAKMALAEAGRPDLAELAYVAVEADGRVALRFDQRSWGGLDQTVLKAVGLDPVFEPAGVEI